MMQARTSLSEARAILGNRLQPFLLDALADARRTWERDFQFAHLVLEVPARANIIHDYFYKNAAARLTSDRSVRYDKKQNQSFLTFGHDRLLIRLKQFDDRLLGVNYPTDRAIDFVQQRELEGMPKCDRLHLGYRFDLTGLAFKDVFITLPEGELNGWIFQVYGTPIVPAVQYRFPGMGAYAGPVYQYAPLFRA